MPTVKRSVANLFERALGVHIIKPDNLGRTCEEQHLKRIFKAFQIDCVFDVGANNGQYARMLRERVGYRGLIVSFEPTPDLARELQQQAQADENWIIRDVALDRNAGRQRFNVTQDSQFSSLRQPSAFGREMFGQATIVSAEVEVQTSTVAIEFERLVGQRPFTRPYLKMDTQGHDLAVAAGAGAALARFVGIQTEAAVQKIYEDTPDISQAIAYFCKRGFELSAFVPNNEGTFPLLIETDCIFVNAAVGGLKGEDASKTEHATEERQPAPAAA